MSNLNNTFNSFKNNSYFENLSVCEDFEDKVFSKIQRKKTVRKHMTAAFVGFCLACFLFLAQVLFIHKNPVENKRIIAQRESTLKEEIPLMEDVIFTSSDSQNDYAVEQVAYYTGDGTI